jgi:hypothetical protein
MGAGVGHVEAADQHADAEGTPARRLGVVLKLIFFFFQQFLHTWVRERGKTQKLEDIFANLKIFK